ncbi:MAG: tyrosine-protein phosphatase [Acidobacteria bacterium]|nr:tyrosine-protein phosphatase [Acidobacteriota bacterium]
MQKLRIRDLLTSFGLFLFFTFTVSAQTSPENFPSVRIRNFGQMDERFFRGAQPLPDDFQTLKDLGVQTVIDLRNDPTDYEKTAVEALGMKYVNIPMSGWRYPKQKYIDQFLSLMADAGTGTVYVHCKAGIHRTGIAGAVYRFTKYGWDYDRAYREMKNYNFSSGLVHGRLKNFVEDYAEKMKADQAKIAAAPKAATAAAQ